MDLRNKIIIIFFFFKAAFITTKKFNLKNPPPAKTFVSFKYTHNMAKMMMLKSLYGFNWKKHENLITSVVI